MRVRHPVDKLDRLDHQKVFQASTHVSASAPTLGHFRPEKQQKLA